MDFAELLEAQHGAFTRAQARDAGFSDYRIARRVTSGEWTIATSSVLCLTGSAAGSRLRGDWIALLAAGRGALLAGSSAARFFGMEAPATNACVVVPEARHVRISGARVLREQVPEEDVVLVAEAALTCRERTVIDCLVLLPEGRALAYLDRALQKKWISADELARRVQQRAGRLNTPKLVRLMRLVSGGAQFEAERRLVTLLRTHRIDGWLCNLAVPGIGVIDVAFLQLRLAIEVDGIAWHSDPSRFQSDRTKQNKLTAEGWTVLRFTWQDLLDRPGQVISTIAWTLQRLAAAQAG